MILTLACFIIFVIYFHKNNFFISIRVILLNKNVSGHYFCSTRVSNELGAGNVNGAKNAMFVTLKLSVILAVIIVVALGFGHHLWSGLFSDSTTIIKAFASITPLLAMSITVDTFQGILSG